LTHTVRVTNTYNITVDHTQVLNLDWLP